MHGRCLQADIRYFLVMLVEDVWWTGYGTNRHIVDGMKWNNVVREREREWIYGMGYIHTILVGMNEHFLHKCLRLTLFMALERKNADHGCSDYQEQRRHDVSCMRKELKTREQKTKI